MTVIPIVPVKRRKAAPSSKSVKAADAATQFFRNYTKRETRVPMPLWWLARGAVLLAALGLAVLLIVQPALGLKLFGWV